MLLIVFHFLLLSLKITFAFATSFKFEGSAESLRWSFCSFAKMRGINSFSGLCSQAENNLDFKKQVLNYALVKKESDLKV